MKFFEKDFKNVRVMSSFKIATIWNTRGTDTAAQMIPTKAGTIKNFKSNNPTKEKMKKHCDLVCATSNEGVDTSRYFDMFDTVPVDMVALNTRRNL